MFYGAEDKASKYRKKNKHIFWVHMEVSRGQQT